MTDSEKTMWLTNITEMADRVAAVMGHGTVEFVFGNYGAESLDDMRPECYEAVFGELATIEENFG